MVLSYLSHLFCALVLLICSGVLGHKSFSNLPPDDVFIPHAFIQTGEELHYFTDIVEQEIVFTTFAPDQSEKPDYSRLSRSDVYLEPEEINFEPTTVGVPLKHDVTITNRMKKDLYFLAIASTSLSFHCSFPKEPLLTQDASTTFAVFFLPPDVGEFENILIILTSNGVIHYHLKGLARRSPYRIQSISGVLMPLNSTFTSPIKVHNPHPTTLSVTEIISSSSKVHLELSELDEIRDDTYWEIAPYQTRTLGYATIVGGEEANSTSYISLKLSLKDSPQASDALNINRHLPSPPDMLYILLEYKILKQRSIYSVKNAFDFGLIKFGDKSEQHVVDVYSTVEKGIDIETIYVDKSDFSHGVYFEYASKPPISIKPGTTSSPGPIVALAKVTVDSNFIMRQSFETPDVAEPQLIHINGKIIAESRGGNYNISVPYRASVYSGSLTHNAEDVAFYHKLKTPVYRSVSFTNNLPFGIVVYNVTMAPNATNIFKANLITSSTFLEPKEQKEVIMLEYLAPQPLTYTTTFTLYTNVSTFEYPIMMFNGNLRVSINALDKSQFDFGHIESHNQRSITFAIINENPVQMTIKKLQPPTVFSSLTILGVENGNSTKLTTLELIKYRHGIKATISCGNPLITHQKKIFVIQTEFGSYQYPVTSTLTYHSVYPLPTVIDFGKVFPTMVSKRSLEMVSTFPNNIPVDRVSLSNADPRFYFEKRPISYRPEFKKGEISKVVTVKLKPEAAPTSEQYVGMPLTSHDGQWFAYAMKFPANLAEIDSYLYRRLRKRFNTIVSKGQNFINTSVMIDTPVVKNYEVPARAELVWPKLLSHSVVRFPLTAVGNFTILNLTLTNPSSRPVIVQLLPLVIYPDAESFLDFFKDEFPAPLIEPVETNETLMFSLRDTELFTLKPNSPVPKMREEVEKVVGSNIPRFTLSMLLKPKMKTRIRIGFLPSDYELHSSLLIIRNNLTVIEPVVLYGQGAQIDVKVENKTTRSEPSLFEIQPIHLKDCFNPKRQMHKLSTTLTVKRPFEVVNTGEVAFTVSNLTLNNVPCENRGFHIINCHPFHLAPGESHILEIAYTPDFLMAINEASLQLYMHMNGTPWVFYIGATIPPSMLAMCHTALPRPPFESFMYYSCILALIFCLICVLACSYLEGDRLITYTIRTEISQIIRRVFSGSESEPSQPPMQPPSRRRPSHYRNHVQASQNSSFIVRWFCSAANVFLWLFSFVWMAVRSEPAEEPPRKKKPKKQPKPVAPEPVPHDSPRPTKKKQEKAEAGPPRSNERIKPDEKNISKETEVRRRKNTPLPETIKNETLPAQTESKNHKKSKYKSPKPKKVVEKVPSDPEPVAAEKKAPLEISKELLEAVAKDRAAINARLNKLDVPQINSLSLPSEENYQNTKEDDSVDSGEESGTPEWADEQVDVNNYDADFADMVQATAEVFSSRADTPASSSSSSRSSAPPQMHGRESELTTDETDASRMEHLDPTRARKKNKERLTKAQETRNYIEMMTKQYREQLEKAMQKREAEKTIYDQIDYNNQDRNLGWPMSMMEQQRLYMQQMFYHNLQQYGWGAYNQMYGQMPQASTARPYRYYEPFLDPLYENRETIRASPPGFSSDSSSQPSFQNSQLGPIGPISKPPPRAADPPVTTTDAPQSRTTFGSLFSSVGDSSFPSSSSRTTTTPQYNLFGGDSVWEPLLGDIKAKAPEWPDLDKKDNTEKKD